MAFDVTALAAYIEDQDFPLVAQMQAVGGLNDIPGVVMQTGLKGSSNLQLFNTDAVFAADSCTRTSGETSTFTQRTITVGAIQGGENLCVKDLNGYWTQTLVREGARNEGELPVEVERVWTEDKMNSIRRAIDVADWQGNATTGTGNNAFYDGLIEVIDSSGSAVDGNPTGITVATGITEANIIGILQGMWKLQPEQILDAADVYIFMGSDVYNCYVNALINANLFHYIGEDGLSTLHGTNVKIVKQVGLTGTDRLFLSRSSNIVVGMDGASDEDEFAVRQDPTSNKLILFDYCFKRGTQVYWPDEIVEFTLV